MPDLGKYADAVLSAYAVSLVLLFVLVLMSLRKGRAARRTLEKVERKGSPNA